MREDIGARARQSLDIGRSTRPTRQLERVRVPDAASKRHLLSAIERARKSMPLSAALRILRLSSARDYTWIRTELCDRRQILDQLRVLREQRSNRGVLRVRRAHVHGAIRNTTKTGKRRMVPFPAELAAVLADHWRRMVETQHPGFQDGWVFANGAGKPQGNDSLCGANKAAPEGPSTYAATAAGEGIRLLDVNLGKSAERHGILRETQPFQQHTQTDAHARSHGITQKWLESG